MRPKYVYRLVVEYPDKPVIDEDNHSIEGLYPWEDGLFQWPQNRCYLSLGAAQRRAVLFERYGATAVIVRSKPIEWEDSTPVDVPRIQRRLRKLLAELSEVV